LETKIPFNLIIDSVEWEDRKEKHRLAVTELVDDYFNEKQHQHTNPVVDFLFKYYNFRYASLKKWSPGYGVLLLDGADCADFQHPEYSFLENDAFVDAATFPEKRIRGLRWMHLMLLNTRERQPLLNCCGMHEWAMVYKAPEVRHQAFPLRLAPKEIETFVETHPIVCTHFDAFRFFTEEARPLNKNLLTRDTFELNEQPGCLHTNMDLYKWAFKLYPWVGSDIILEAFRLAMQARKLDMMAGPYDLASIGYEAIPIETESGRVRYKQEQAAIWKAGIPVRNTLIEAMETLLNHIEETHEHV